MPCSVTFNQSHFNTFYLRIFLKVQITHKWLQHKSLKEAQQMSLKSTVILVTMFFKMYICHGHNCVLRFLVYFLKLFRLFRCWWNRLVQLKKWPCREIVGPSGVRALPLAAGRNVGGHYKWHYFLSPLSFLFRLIANSPRRGCRRVPKFCIGS